MKNIALILFTATFGLVCLTTSIELRAESDTKTIKIKQSTPPSASSRLSSWLKSLKKRIVRSEAKNNKLVAVAAVRGNKVEDAPPLYWKGKSEESKIEMPELKKFDEAISKALDGDNEAAISGLEEFVKEYPQSALIPEANETLALLSGTQPE